MRKITILFSLFLLGIGFSMAQTKVKVNFFSGTTQNFDLLETGKMYFSDSEIIIDDGDSNIAVVPISDIRSVVFDEQTLGVVSLDKQNGMVLYPNPVSNYVTIHKEKKELMDVTIFNLQGQLVHSGQYNSDSKIDVSNLNPGVYVVKANGVNLKFIKK